MDAIMITPTSLCDVDSVSESQFEVDPKSLTNILLPLALYRQPPFPSEEAFHNLLKLIQVHLVANPRDSAPVLESSIDVNNCGRTLGLDLEITSEFLFSVCGILSSGGPGTGQLQELSSPSRIKTTSIPSLTTVLPAVLRCLRKTWRVLPLEDRSPAKLALDLAALANCPSSMLEPAPCSPSRLRIRWINNDSDDRQEALLAFDINNGDTHSSCDLIITPDQPKPSRDMEMVVGLDIPKLSRGPEVLEMAVFRSGCGACRRPRTNRSSGPLDLASPPCSSLQATNAAHKDRSRNLRSPPLPLAQPEVFFTPVPWNGKTLRTIRHLELQNDENTPPLPVLAPTPRGRASRGRIPATGSLSNHSTQLHAHVRPHSAKSLTTSSTRTPPSRVNSIRNNKTFAVPAQPILIPTVVTATPLSRFASSINSPGSTGRATASSALAQGLRASSFGEKTKPVHYNIISREEQSYPQ